MKTKRYFTEKDLEDEIIDIKNAKIIGNKIIYDIDYESKCDRMRQLLILCGAIIIFLFGLSTGLLFILDHG